MGCENCKQSFNTMVFLRPTMNGKSFAMDGSSCVATNTWTDAGLLLWGQANGKTLPAGLGMQISSKPCSGKFLKADQDDIDYDAGNGGTAIKAKIPVKKYA